jgi:glutamyl-tRNA synthetase
MRALGGKFLLRIEDLDPGRSRTEFTEMLYRDLEYLGIEWDETPLVQSERLKIYDQALERLAAAGMVYSCFCSRAEVQRSASAPHGPLDEGPVYPGTCARLSPQQIAARNDRKPSVRFRAPDAEICFDDEVLGLTCQNVAEAVGDFVVRRNDGVASYQLAVVVDDASSEVTHVLRGSDLLTSTPRQITLYRALGFEVPQFAHVPLLVAPDGKRMAKRDGAMTVARMREQKVDARKVVGLLARWAHLCEEDTVSTRELVAGFSLKKLAPGPVVVDEVQTLKTLGL